MFARVIAFSAQGRDLTGLVDTLRTGVWAEYQQLPGFSALVAMASRDQSEVVAITFWEGQEGVEDSALIANTVVDRIARHVGSVPSISVFDVIGSVGLGPHAGPGASGTRTVP